MHYRQIKGYLSYLHLVRAANQASDKLVQRAVTAFGDTARNAETARKRITAQPRKMLRPSEASIAIDWNINPAGVIMETIAESSPK